MKIIEKLLQQYVAYNNRDQYIIAKVHFVYVAFIVNFLSSRD